MESCIADNEKDLNDNNAEREKLELQKQDARVVTNRESFICKDSIRHGFGG